MKRIKYLHFLIIINGWFFCCQSVTTDKSFDSNNSNSQHDVVYNICDTIIKDNYSKYEDIGGKVSWYFQQDSIAESYFQTNSHYKEYLKKFSSFEDEEDPRINYIRSSERGNLFYIKVYPESKHEYLYNRNSYNSEETRIINLTDSLKHDVSYLNPSLNGEKIAVGYENNDGFTSTIKFYDLKNGLFLKDSITNINTSFGGIEWMPDNNSFAYLYFPNIDNQKPNFKKHSYTVLYHLDEESGAKNVFGKKFIPEMNPVRFPKVKMNSSIQNYVIGYIASSSDYYAAYISKKEDFLNGNPEWEKFYDIEDKIYYSSGVVRGDYYYCRMNIDNAVHLVKVSIDEPDFKNPEIIARGSEENPVYKFACTKNNIYYSRLNLGLDLTTFRIDKNSEVEEIQLPFNAGYIKYLYNSTQHNKIGAGVDGWLSPYKRFEINNLDFNPMAWANSDSKNTGNYNTELLFVNAHDGLKIPLTIIKSNDDKSAESTQVLLQVYGAYGENFSPFYSRYLLNWVEEGGVLAIAHVRGGGERGKKWHLDGQKTLKYNSWRDLNSVSNYLIKNGITDKGKIHLYTSSAGGITAGMAVNESPTLYGSFIADVPRLHPFGLERATTTSDSYLEYGSIEDEDECKGLITMDPYLNISKQSYPAILIMPSYNDDRIPLWDSGKYIAKLNDLSSSNSPILLDIDYENGHESSYEFIDVYYSKIFSFIKENSSSQN